MPAEAFTIGLKTPLAVVLRYINCWKNQHPVIAPTLRACLYDPTYSSRNKIQGGVI